MTRHISPVEFAELGDLGDEDVFRAHVNPGDFDMPENRDKLLSDFQLRTD